ncbi:hypothetical protein [Soonwooa sp.]|uniref:hypothetical protein n=1 Tax=Soonwooa sp. TaxID=1938592 RepID=UPI0028B0EB76|nr:hypothetical protein [Soonwooa sp.]
MNYCIIIKLTTPTGITKNEKAQAFSKNINQPINMLIMSCVFKIVKSKNENNAGKKYRYPNTTIFFCCGSIVGKNANTKNVRKLTKIYSLTGGTYI